MNFSKTDILIYTGVIVSIFFVWGFAVAPCPEQECPVCEEQVVTKEVEVCPNEETWKELKLLDDLGFEYASRGFSATSNTIYALIDGDVARYDRNMDELEQITEDLYAVKNERAKLLEKLGY